MENFSDSKNFKKISGGDEKNDLKIIYKNYLTKEERKIKIQLQRITAKQRMENEKQRQEALKNLRNKIEL